MPQPLMRSHEAFHVAPSPNTRSMMLALIASMMKGNQNLIGQTPAIARRRSSGTDFASNIFVCVAHGRPCGGVLTSAFQNGAPRAALGETVHLIDLPIKIYSNIGHGHRNCHSAGNAASNPAIRAGGSSNASSHDPVVEALLYSVARFSKKLACSTAFNISSSQGSGFFAM